MTAVLLLVTACTSAGAPAQVSSTVDVSGSASELLDTLGVNLHITYPDTAYGDQARLLDKVRDLGVPHVRDGLKVGRSQDLDPALEALEAASVSVTLIFGNPRHDAESGTTAEALDWLAGPGRSVDALEGANEWDCSGDPDWKRTLRGYQAEVRRAVAAAPRVSGLPLLGPSFCRSGNTEDFGLLDDVDVVNAHVYAGGDMPEREAAEAVDRARATAPGRPVWITETGYHNALGGGTSQPGVSEEVAATYLLRTYLEHARLGVERTFLYELFDEKPDDTGRDQEQHFGLLRSDGTEKPGYRAVRALVRLLEGVGGSADLPFGVTVAADDDVRRVLFVAEGGRGLLFLWRAVPVGAESEGRDLRDVGAAQPVRVGTSVGTRASRADPTTGDHRLRPVGQGSEHLVEVGPDPVALLLERAP